jgi:drug/metabolite transporter (DMT)-like permease
MTLLLLIIFLLALNLSAGVLIKISPSYYTNLPALAGLAVGLFGLYFVQTIIWLVIGKKYQLSYVYPFMSINYVLALVVGLFLFHEQTTISRTAGAFIIMLGSILIATSPHSQDK